MSEHNCADVRWGLSAALSQECRGGEYPWCDGPYSGEGRERRCVPCGQRMKRRHKVYTQPEIHAEDCRCGGRGRILIDPIGGWISCLPSSWVIEDFWLITQERSVVLCSWDSRRKNLGQGDDIIEAIQMALCKQEGLHPEEVSRGD